MISFTVYGTPIPQGSTKAFIPKGWKRAIITADNKKTKPWRQEIAQTAQAEMGKLKMLEREIPVTVRCEFFFAKPKSTKKSVFAKTTKPDLDKLARSLLDALTGIVFEDDSQVTMLVVSKGFGNPRAEISVTADVLEEDYEPEQAAVPDRSCGLEAILAFEAESRLPPLREKRK